MGVAKRTLAGAMTDVPPGLIEQVKRLEEMFIVETPKLKEITKHFESELVRGMQRPCHRLFRGPSRLHLDRVDCGRGHHCK